jgi:hypothetical protein
LKISEHFAKREFEKSGTALRLGISNVITDPEHLLNLSSLCATVLEPIREKFGPMSISSGYRHPDLSQALGSKPTSSHCFAEAGLSWDQAIIEFCPENSEDPFDGWIHLSSKRVKSENRGDVLRAVKNDGKTVYERLN